MWNQNKKQKKGIIFSTAVIALGCLLSALYANSAMKQSGDYSVDLSQLDGALDNATGQNEEAQGLPSDGIGADAGAAQELARASGSDVVNPSPAGKLTAQLEREKAMTGQAEIVPAGNEAVMHEEETLQTPETLVPDASLHFAPEDGCGWPVNGDVILGYSMDKSIFFETLQQYRYNPAIYISAQEGDNVSACAKGQVTEIGSDVLIGQYVKMNLGDGYEVTYGQLDDLEVAKGDTVARGQVIAKVAPVTKYYAVEGMHVYLKIEKDGQPVDPMELME